MWILLVVVILFLILFAFRWGIDAVSGTLSHTERINQVAHTDQDGGLSGVGRRVSRTADILNEQTERLKELERSVDELGQGLEAEVERMALLSQDLTKRLDDFVDGLEGDTTKSMEALKADLEKRINQYRDRLMELRQMQVGILSLMENFGSAYENNQDTQARLERARVDLEKHKAMLTEMEAELGTVEQLGPLLDALLLKTERHRDEDYRFLVKTVDSFGAAFPKWGDLLRQDQSQVRVMREHIKRLNATVEACRMLIQNTDAARQPMFQDIQRLGGQVQAYRADTKSLLEQNRDKLGGLDIPRWRAHLGTLEARAEKVSQRVGDYGAARDYRGLQNIDRMLQTSRSTDAKVRDGKRSVLRSCEGGTCELQPEAELCVANSCLNRADVRAILANTGLRMDGSLVLFLESATQGMQLQDLSGKGNHFALNNKTYRTRPVPNSPAQGLLMSGACVATGPIVISQKDHTLIVIVRPKARNASKPLAWWGSHGDHQVWIPNASREITYGQAKATGFKAPVLTKHYAFRQQGNTRSLYENGQLKASGPLLESSGPDEKGMRLFEGWEGEFYAFLVFDRALSAEEILGNFGALRFRYNIPDGDILVRKTDLGRVRLPDEYSVRTMNLTQQRVWPPATVDAFKILQDPSGAASVTERGELTLKGDYRNMDYEVVIGGMRAGDLVSELKVQVSEPNKPPVVAAMEIAPVKLTEDDPTALVDLTALFSNPSKLKLTYEVDGVKTPSNRLFKWSGNKQTQTVSVVAVDRFGRRSASKLVLDHAQPNPVNCVVSDWNDWGACSASCGGGTQTKTRSVLRYPAYGGSNCPVTSESRTCNTQPCPVNCVVSPWSYGTCSENCGGGQQVNARRVIQEAANGGAPCPVLFETVPCNTQACAPTGPSQCSVGAWGPWTGCSASCGGGIRSRSREVVSPGVNCPPLQEFEACNTQACQQEKIEEPVVVIPKCDGAWSDWGPCSATCGTGQQTRNRNMGVAGCTPEAETRSCNTQPCETTTRREEVIREPEKVDCRVSDWSNWSNCTADCGGGEQIRTRHVVTQPANGGVGCPTLQERQRCNTHDCYQPPPIDCEPGDWGEWSSCRDLYSGICGWGKKSRTRGIRRREENGGAPCGNLTETTDCEVKCPEPINNDDGGRTWLWFVTNGKGCMVDPGLRDLCPKDPNDPFYFAKPGVRLWEKS